MAKPGFKTTEFWLSLVAMLVGAIMASGVLDATETALDNQIVGMIAMMLTGLGYTVARSFAKGTEAKAEAFKASAPPSNPT